MALSFEQLKAAFGKRTTGSSNENTGFWDKFYPFYKMDFSETALFRFLPDADEENPLGFIIENKYHEFTVNGKRKRIACLKMHDGADAHCPACAASAKYYNELGDEKMGKLFWRKIDYIGAGLVMHSPFDYPIRADENPVRLISLGPKLFKRIETSIASGDFDVAPYDLDEGFDFKIMKTKQGEYADYSSSEFVRKSTAISAALRSQLELVDLKKFRFARVDADAMQAQIEAFITGKSYEDEKASSTPASEPDTSLKQTPVLSAAAPAGDSAPAGDGGSASDRARALLARINKDRAAK
jgi:hypothetical protein